ncbi:hypothetical protein ROLI_034070 [Roseobacter fucihabitans]|uniref:Uncharacterized protein n=1 Tax=Roseobacter fucihabitans TaxID=1537242 RepID=A0ABZ2BXX2_9RHOB|nr:hypothetical protein [Roseobacter litoralis]MBC6967429.1 hypothetical protein [Roseobacter litoralis]
MRDRKNHRPSQGNRPPVQSRNAAGRVARNDMLTAVQQQADQCPTTGALNALQRQATGVIQRDVVKSDAPDWAKEDFIDGVGRDTAKSNPVDRSPLTHNGSYDARGNLAGDGSAGPAAWASEHYERMNEGPAGVDDRAITHNAGYDAKGDLAIDRSNALAREAYLNEPMTLMCSMVDGKIGSIYFEGGRVRTTHTGGPTKSEHNKNRLFQFNIDRNAAHDHYTRTGDKKRWEKHFRDAHPTSIFNEWLAQALKGEGVTATPAWATPVLSADDALPDDGNQDAAGLKLFEVMVKRNGRLGKHPSRGALVKMTATLTRAELTMLKKVGETISDRDNPHIGNVMFYNFVKTSLPQLLPYIRTPEEIKAEDAEWERTHRPKRKKKRRLSF